MKTLATNGKYKLVYFSQAINRYAVYMDVNASESGELMFKQMVCWSPVFSKKIKSYFTKDQVQEAIAKVQFMKDQAKKS